MESDEALLMAISVAAELTGTQISKVAARAMADDLARYPRSQVLGALGRCRREIRGRLTVADVITRLDDGRPGAEEAWAMLPKNEQTSVVWTQEMATAFGVVVDLLDSDPVAARMAFKETYSSAVQHNRDNGIPVQWSPSLGHDPAGREAVLLDAAEKGRLTREHVAELLPPERMDAGAWKALTNATKLLSTEG